MPPSVLIAGQRERKWMRSLGFCCGDNGEAGEEVIHAFNSPSSSEGRGDGLRCGLGAETTGMGLRPRGRSRQGDPLAARGL